MYTYDTYFNILPHHYNAGKAFYECYVGGCTANDFSACIWVPTVFYALLGKSNEVYAFLMISLDVYELMLFSSAFFSFLPLSSAFFRFLPLRAHVV